MAKRKWFSVRYQDGSTLCEYSDWNTFKHKVDGKKGVAYKGFDSKHEAQSWIQLDAIPYRTADTPHEKDICYIYVDGSFSSKRDISGWGFVVVKNDNILKEDYGYKDNLYGSRNIVGELFATMVGVKWAIEAGEVNPIVVHDYNGIANWALNYWEARSEIAILYKRYMLKYQGVRFEKVSGHKGIKWNEYADTLTRKGYPD